MFQNDSNVQSSAQNTISVESDENSSLVTTVNNENLSTATECVNKPSSIDDMSGVDNHCLIKDNKNDDADSKSDSFSNTNDEQPIDTTVEVGKSGWFNYALHTGIPNITHSFIIKVKLIINFSFYHLFFNLDQPNGSKGDKTHHQSKEQKGGRCKQCSL